MEIPKIELFVTPKVGQTAQIVQTSAARLHGFGISNQIKVKCKLRKRAARNIAQRCYMSLS